MLIAELCFLYCRTSFLEGRGRTDLDKSRRLYLPVSKFGLGPLVVEMRLIGLVYTSSPAPAG